ncbi:MAG: Gfo/Idh/MocA family oxidoreductase [Bacteroidetes bacterium]|nr:Gfo/Idh/MocA family oxidoreductase [Bacteroidota bacterium]
MKKHARNTSRRDFIKKSAVMAAGVPLVSNMAYSKILGANDTLNVAVAGINSRGVAHINTLLKLDNVNIIALCDVDSKVLDKRAEYVKEKGGGKVKKYKDFRKLIENNKLDAVFIASPDHTHAPFAIYALQAGLHVYLEKPCSQNPQEGEMLIEAQKKYGKLVQIGNQQRSAPTSQMAIKDIAEGLIGDVYEAKCWYANNRGSIGNGKAASAPEHIDWDLWQGPAPRKEFRDNIVHYNWHWFRHWGTGEICNNGLHEMDICRWALGVKNPVKVMSQGGRYHFKNDDWQFFDTQIARFEFENGKALTWEGRSCNGLLQYERGRGTVIYGTKGSMLLDRNDYFAYDLGGKEIKHESEAAMSQTTNTLGEGALTDYHIENFLEAIRKDTPLNSPIHVANYSNHLCHLGNMAQDAGKTLEIDPKTGKVTNHDKAMMAWGRE